jgi:hypothetical protein
MFLLVWRICLPFRHVSFMLAMERFIREYNVQKIMEQLKITKKSNKIIQRL